MKKIAIIIYLLICSTILFAQTQNTANWKIYNSPKDEFSVEIPKDFEEDFRIIDDPNKNKIYVSARYLTEFSGTFYYVFSEVIDQANGNLVEIPFTQLKAFIANNAAKPAPIKIGNFTGEQYSFKDSEDFFHKIVFVHTQKRAYIFHTFGVNEVNADSDRFFSSIKFREIEDSQFTKSPATIMAEKFKTSPDADSGGGKGSGQGSGSGSGGSGNGVGAGSPSSTTGKQTSPLKILSKPRPGYTDLARIYGIQGTVTLRVTFLTNGNIGAVSIVSKLPFGLTNNSISAAKRINFEPQIKDGVAYTVTKTLQYSFTLY
ncbi:MAG TPA: energy transducer TonB [Pyrinomonadaceae bacterium]|nr:energy transducer TonB [Pyrinomonadaceae bacterium]